MATSAAPSTGPADARAMSARPGSKVVRRYVDGDGTTREMIARPGHGGSTLVIDRDLLDGEDARLIAHLSADEPATNVGLICRSYLDAEPPMRRCRALSPKDEASLPLGLAGQSAVSHDERSTEHPMTRFRLVRVQCRMTIAELRWARSGSAGTAPAASIVSLREAIAAAECYQPFCETSREAIERFADDETVSTTLLRTELNRVLESPIVLNRGLREAVMRRIATDRTSMSEIAIRCERRKRDSKGNESGETSWLARRIGLLPEGGQQHPTRWVHSDVLGLIAWKGLGIAPREVELG
jgi:hypothetical protein